MTDLTPVIEILLVDDDPGDVLMTREVFEQSASPRRLSVVSDGESAMDYLYKRGKHTAAVRPDLVLLDLNLPRMDGREVLAELKSDPLLRTIPVVVLTTSKAENDVVNSYALHANAFVTKPVDFDHFAEVIRRIDDFFTTVVRLPGR